MNLLHRRRRELRLAALIATAAAAMGASLLAHAAIMNGGLIELSETFFAAGGGGTPSSGGTLGLIDTIGGPAETPMAGGKLTLMPGGVGIPPAAAQDFSFIHAFPTPYQPSLGHDRITFRGLPPRVTIKIYTITGQYVKTLTKNDPLTADLIWKPVENESGRPLASGVYFYQVSGDTGRASGKLMVIR